jgi:AraC-like DNA-binding protein/mannose-6-phosphate isomerase-like protein (cupin superfamily)
MKARLDQISITGNEQSFTGYRLNVPEFSFLWHYHPEYELTYIVKGKGKRFVGDSYQDFEPGDLVLLGSMLPHTWVSEASHHEKCEAIVIQFSSDFIEPLFRYAEINSIQELLQQSKTGLHFKQVKKDVLLLLEEIASNKGAIAFTSLIKVLHLLSPANYTPLSSEHFKAFKSSKNQQRINKVFLYVQQNYTGDVSLQNAAAMVHLSESAFCKFFKRISGKTFSDYVNEIRVAKACELLIETDKPIEQIAFETGFESQTYFNRIFLRKKASRPKDYRSRNSNK